MQDSIFTQIIKGQIPCYKIYEDENSFVFLDIHPIQEGQVLVIPKVQVDQVWELDSATYDALMATAHKVAKHMQLVFPAKHRVALQVEGLEVTHAHLKIYPFNTHDEYKMVPDKSREVDHSALAAIAERLRMDDSV